MNYKIFTKLGMAVLLGLVKSNLREMDVLYVGSRGFTQYDFRIGSRWGG